MSPVCHLDGAEIGGLKSGSYSVAYTLEENSAPNQATARLSGLSEMSGVESENCGPAWRMQTVGWHSGCVNLNHDKNKLCGMCNLQILKRPKLPKGTRFTPIGTAPVQTGGESD